MYDLIEISPVLNSVLNEADKEYKNLESIDFLYC